MAQGRIVFLWATRVKLLHRDCLIAHYWLCFLQHTFLLWPLEAPSSLCVTSSLSRWSWRSYSYSMKWSLNFSMGTTWTRSEKTRTPPNQWRKREERRRGIRPPHQVRGITLRPDDRWENSAKWSPLVPLYVVHERQICGTGDFSTCQRVFLSSCPNSERLLGLRALIWKRDSLWETEINVKTDWKLSFEDMGGITCNFTPD